MASTWEEHNQGISLGRSFPLSRLLGAPEPTGPETKEFLGKLKSAHAVARAHFGDNGMGGMNFWGKDTFLWFLPHSAAECMNPNAYLLCLGHAGMACLMGAPMQGHLANPSPSSLFLSHVGSDSVGKSRHTSFLRKVLQAVETSARIEPPKPDQPDVNGLPDGAASADADMEVFGDTGFGPPAKGKLKYTGHLPSGV
ncbi:unnamed protein product [Polarella glacialis]|uniref:Uncharacterized protein n=1 Tax=Polarella glacialis TaxID=89957 RepID=A0A813G7W8_POLGL|nr:unnamed protein product [Polarella glacialis]